MKDSEIRGLILRYYYDHRRGEYTLPKPSDISPDLTREDVLCVANQLAEHGLIEWRRLGSHGRIRTGIGKINAFGIDVVESGAQTELKVEFVNKKINITGSQNIVVGDNNQVKQSVHDLVELIENSHGNQEQKEEAKVLLRKFLEHPLVSSVVGGAIGLLG